MKIVVVSDSFKGSLSSLEICHLAEDVLRDQFPSGEIRCIPVSDGGEGTVDALAQLPETILHYVTTQNPLGCPVTAKYVQLNHNTCLIELAQASGLTLIPRELRDPLAATTFGTGLLIRDALSRGIRNIMVSIGGSATCDGGAGLLEALGVRFFDRDYHQLHMCGENLQKIVSADCSFLHPSLQKGEVAFDVLCDVENPLLGPSGAVMVYGPQKGADTAEKLAVLEQGMTNYAQVMEQVWERGVRDLPGAGAAGGAGFALMGGLNAGMRSGIDAMLEFMHFTDELRNADLVITGEGCLDNQSCQGKVVAGVCKKCQAAGVPVISISGIIRSGYESLYKTGLWGAVSTVGSIMTLDDALNSAEELYRDALIRVSGLIKCGMKLSENARRKDI